MAETAVFGDIDGLLADLEELGRLFGDMPSDRPSRNRSPQTEAGVVVLRKMGDRMAALKASWMRREERLAEMTAVVMSMTTLDFNHRLEPSRDDEGMDTLGAGLNMLSEELEAATVSRRYLDDILQSMPDMLMVLGPDGIIETANKTVSSILGFPAERMAGMGAEKIIFTGDDPEHIKPVSEYPAHPRQQVWYRKSDGGLVPVAFSCALLDGDNGIGARCILSARDVTEQKRVLDALEESEKRFRAMVDGAMDGILVADLETQTFRTTNRAMERMLGYSRDEILTLGVADIHPPERLPYVMDQFRQQAEGTKQLAENIPVRRKDGSVFIADVNSTRIMLQGKPYVMGIFRDVTEQREAAEVLKSSENRFRALFNNISSGVAVYDVKDEGGRFLFRDINRAAENIDRMARRDVIGRDVADVFPGIRDMGLLAVFTRVWKTGKPEHFPAVIYADDRISGWRENYIYRLPSGELVAVYDDVTEKKAAEEALKSTMEKLERSNRELTDFAHIASHDLKEPLRKIVTFGERIKAKAAGLDERSRDYLTRMQNSAERMMGLLEGLLEYARITTKVRPFKRVDLRRIITEVLSDLEVRVQETGASVTTRDLPAVNADPLQMRQLFQNLIGNALKYHRGGVAPAITIWCESRADENGPIYEIAVKDNGIGIAEEHSDRIFGVFQRLHGSGEYEGAGVGLSICKKIVDLHGGHISLSSTVGHGSTFIVNLPGNPGMDVDPAGTKLNCWEHRRCGREDCGEGADTCPAALDIPGTTGTNGGLRGGRYCWHIAGTMCQGKIQGAYANKIDSCGNCEFYLRVKEEEGADFKK